MKMTRGCKSFGLCQPWLLLVFVALPAILLPAEALSRRPAVYSNQQQQRNLTGKGNSLAFLVSMPRGGESSEKSTESVEMDVEEEDETEAEETIESAVKEIEAEVQELVDEVVEEAAEAMEEEVAELVEEVVEDEIEEAVEEIEDEEGDEEIEVEEDVEVEVVFTDGELADDEGIYTDGQNEPAAESIAATEVPAGGAEDDVEEVADASIEVATTAAVIDDDLKEILITDLRYTEDDIANMRPEIAKEVVLNKLVRPIEGMPKNWYVDPEAVVKNPSILSQLKKKKRLLVSVAAVGVAALSVGALKENDAIEDMVDSIKDSLSSIVDALKSTAKRESPSADVQVEPEEEAEEEEPIASNTDSEIHSIKPGTTQDEVPDPNADHTWLDKVLTRIGGAFKALWTMKI